LNWLRPCCGGRGVLNFRQHLHLHLAGDICIGDRCLPFFRYRVLGTRFARLPHIIYQMGDHPGAVFGIVMPNLLNCLRACFKDFAFYLGLDASASYFPFSSYGDFGPIRPEWRTRHIDFPAHSLYRFTEYGESVLDRIIDANSSKGMNVRL